MGEKGQSVKEESISEQDCMRKSKRFKGLLKRRFFLKKRAKAGKGFGPLQEQKKKLLGERSEDAHQHVIGLRCKQPITQGGAIAWRTERR